MQLGFNDHMEPITLAEPADVEAALLNEGLVPPPRSATLQTGATAALRDAMARFSHGDLHVARRDAVNEVIAAIGRYQFTRSTWQRTTAIIAATGLPAELDAAAAIGLVVPAECVASALGVDKSDLALVRIDVAEIAAVIGRGEPSTPASDEASARLVGRCGDLGHDPVAAVSLLYQSHDACAAFLASTLVATQTAQTRRSAVAATARTALHAVTLGSTTCSAGTPVVLDLESSGFEFGVGAHGCPGREIAERLVAGMVAAISDAALELDIDRVEWREDHRAQTLPLRPSSSL